MSSNPNIFTVVIVGAGPAGLMAALVAARSGARVIVFEQLPEPGVRLLATGGGHGNFTNTLVTDDFVRCFGEKRRFVAPAIKALDGNRLRYFLKNWGYRPTVRIDFTFCRYLIPRDLFGMPSGRPAEPGAWSFDSTATWIACK